MSPSFFPNPCASYLPEKLCNLLHRMQMFQQNVARHRDDLHLSCSFKEVPERVHNGRCYKGWDMRHAPVFILVPNCNEYNVY